MRRHDRIREFCIWFMLTVLTRCLAPFSLSTRNSLDMGNKLKQSSDAPGRFPRMLLLLHNAADTDEFPEACVQEFEDHDSMEPSLVASPLSQLKTDEEESLYRGTFSRQAEWLETSTHEILETNNMALGSLSEDDVESITGLMAAWVRRRSIDAAVIVEKLLKRVVDDMRAGNSDIHVTSRMYTIAIDAWAKSGAEGGARRAQHIHDAMIEMYKTSGDERIAPCAISYNTVMNAWCKSSDEGAVEMAEKVLEHMLAWENEKIQPDAVTFSTLMDTYARSSRDDAAARAEQLFEMMTNLGVKRNVYTFSALQNVYARSGKPDAPEMTLNVLQRMLDLFKKGDVFAKPNCVNYNAVLSAYSRTPSRESAEAADAMLCKMHLAVEDGGYDVAPDRMSYAMTILACARCPDLGYSASTSELNLEKMEAQAQVAAKRREEISSAAPPSVTLDLESFNVVLTAISRLRRRDSVSRTIEIIKRMDGYANAGIEYVRPNVRSWNGVLNALSRSKEKNAAQRAEQTLDHMFDLHMDGVPNVKPNPFSFAAVLSAYQRLGTPEAVQRADDIVKHMEKLYEAGEIDYPPDGYHYTIVCAAWARSEQKQAPDRCIQIISHMKERDQAGYPTVRPNIRTYNAVLDCLSRSSEAEKAEELLYHILDLARNGDEDSKPDSFTFNVVINAFSRSKLRDAGRRAELVLDRFLEYTEEHPSVRPDVRSFVNIIAHYCRQTEMPDAPYRAEYLLNRMVGMFKSGDKGMSPSVFAFTSVMDSYTQHKHPDAGECAERLLRLMIKLRDHHGAETIEVNRGVMNSVLSAWACSGDDNGGRRADMLLRDMEEQSDESEEELLPNARSYCLVLDAWAKSASFSKAEQSLEVLQRMKRRYSEGKLNTRPGGYPHALVVNACAFTNASPGAEMAAFKIAVGIMEEMMTSGDLTPTSVTYGWFIQACGRLRVPEHLKEENLERAFVHCSEQGLVNDFVLNRLRIAASDRLYNRLMSPAMKRIRKNKKNGHFDKTKTVYLSQLPKSWTRCFRKPRRKTPNA